MFQVRVQRKKVPHFHYDIEFGAIKQLCLSIFFLIITMYEEKERNREKIYILEQVCPTMENPKQDYQSNFGPEQEIERKRKKKSLM